MNGRFDCFSEFCWLSQVGTGYCRFRTLHPLRDAVSKMADDGIINRDKSMDMLFVVRFSKVNYDEWKAVYDADLPLRSQFSKDDVVGKVDDHTAIIKVTITDPDGLQKAMAAQMAEIADELGLEHELFSLTPAG